MYRRFATWQMKSAAKDALLGLRGLGVSYLENRDYCYKHRPDGSNPRECQCNVFWYDTEDLENRYKQEEAKVGDLFYDGNNGDKHTVVAVDLENNRLVYRNLSQNEDLLEVACW